MIGTIKSYNYDRGFGFIAPQDGGSDYFFHVSEVQRAGIPTSAITIGAKLAFEAKLNSKTQKTFASDLKLVKA